MNLGSQPENFWTHFVSVYFGAQGCGHCAASRPCYIVLHLYLPLEQAV